MKQLQGASVSLTRLGHFEGNLDIGKVLLPGSVEFIPARQEYRITGSGENVWARTDAFQLVWRKVSGDLKLKSDITWVGEGKNKHRKAGWMVRQSTEPDAPYADVAVHGDGLISFQYRKVKGGPTLEVQSPITAPATVQLERDGDLFTVSVTRKGGPLQPVGSLTIPLSDPVYAGVFVCSHESNVLETAILSGVQLQNYTLGPGEKRVRETSLEVVSRDTGERQVVHRVREHFEAPNWTPDGKKFLINKRGLLYTLPVNGGEFEQLDTGPCNRCNNDHGFSADGKWLAISHHQNGPSFIYVLQSHGGTPRQVTSQGPSYWHGWSPDGTRLVYCAERNSNFDIYSIPVEGGDEVRLTTAPGLDDGPEFTPDGRKIYFNSERTGWMKIWRMNPDGSDQEQVTRDPDYADWFPHPSPDGKWLVFLSFDKSVKGHPENQDVLLRLMPMAGGPVKTLATLFGGQGTINVPSWSADSKSIAFVSYRLIIPEQGP